MRLLRYFDPVWTVRGSLALPAGQTGPSALDQIVQAITTPGTICARSADGFTMRKAYVASQDPLASFHRGSFHVVGDNGEARVIYVLASRILAWCFVAPFFIAAIGYWSGSYPWSDQLFSLLFLVLFAYGRRGESRKAHRLVSRSIAPRSAGVSHTPGDSSAQASGAVGSLIAGPQ